MTEPKARARKLVPVAADIYRWRVHDDRLGGAESDAYAVVHGGRVVLVDPLPVDEAALRELGELEAVVLTASCHQRSAWRYRKEFGIPVYAPEGAEGLEEEPDHTYSGGDLLPGGLTAFHAPGPAEATYALWSARPRSVVFVSDLLRHDGSGTPTFFPSEWQDEPARTRVSVRRILEDLPVETLCFGHGPPVCGEAREALQRALSGDSERFEEARP